MEHELARYPSKSIATEPINPWNGTFSDTPAPQYGYEHNSMDNFFPDGNVFRSSSVKLAVGSVSSVPKMMFHPISGSRDDVDDDTDSHSMDEATPSIFLQQVSTFSQPDDTHNLRDLEIDFPFTPHTDHADQRGSFGEFLAFVRPRLQHITNAPYKEGPASVFASRSTESPANEFNEVPSLVPESPFQGEVERFLPADDTEGRVVIQTPHGPALLLSSQTFSRLSSPAVASSATPKTATPSSNRKFQHWSEEEDNMLKDAIAVEGKAPYNWKRIAKNNFSNTRSGLQCKSRWTKSLKPGLVRGIWQAHEDALILEMRLDGMKWSAIAEYLPGRIGEHVRDRYVNFLDPTLKRTPWTKEEDTILFEQQRFMGNRWTEISKSLPGRSENAVKNRWHNAKMTQRRRIRKQVTDRSREEQSKRARSHCGSSVSVEEDFAEEPLAEASGVIGV